MTEPVALPTRSKDYWDIVLGQLAKRPSVWLSAGLLVLLYGVAIYAPLLANDRPLVFVGTDRDAYRKAQREIGFVGEALIAKAGAEPLLEAELRAEHGALVLRLDTLRRQLASEHHELPDAAADAAGEVLTSGLAGNVAAVEQAGARLQELTGRIRAELGAVRPGEAVEPGRSVALQPYRTYPALASLTWPEIYIMVLWAFVLTWPLWNPLVNRLLLRGDLERIRAARRRKQLLVWGLPVLPTLLWVGLQGGAGADAFHVSGFKQGLTDASMQAEQARFPLVPYGLAEQNMSETFRPPTWHRSAPIDEQGYYTTGPRAARSDPATGMSIRGDPILVRHGEPERNAAARHPLGTDSLGRDLLARLIWGGRVSLSVGLVSTLLLVFIGTIVGALGGYFGGWVDVAVSRVIEVFQCFPVFFLILIVVAFVGPSILNIMLAIGLFRWTGVARLVRGEFIRLRNQDFVVASEALGVNNARTIFRHVLPNALSPVLVAATFAVASGILTESALSFLGFGVQLPIPSWGSLLIESSQPEHWWIQIFPGLLIFITVIFYNLLGEGVRDALDPRLKEA